MSTEGYIVQLEALAKRLGKQFPLREDELGVQAINFPALDKLVIEATANNLGSRLFAESLAFEPLEAGVQQQVMVTDTVIATARAYFCQYWDDEPLSGKHPFIDALKRAHAAKSAFYLVVKEGKKKPMFDGLEETINRAWEDRGSISVETRGQARDAVHAVLELLDSGALRVAEKGKDGWVVNQWAKKAVLLSFRLNPNALIVPATSGAWYDKVPGKFESWTGKQFASAGIRAVPGSIARRGAFIGKGVVLMPSFVNIGAYVDENAMVDSWATVGSCAQIGKNVHLSGGVGIGGVLEPLQANPTIIEDDCFIGARSEVVEGVIVGQGSVLSMGVFIGESTKIYNRETREIIYGHVPPYSVVVPGSLPAADGTHSLYCAVIVKTVDAQTRAKTSINELLRG